MLKLKLQYFGYLMRRTDAFEKTLMLGKIEGGRRRRQQRMRWLDGITDSMDVSLSRLGSWWWIGRPGVLQSMRSQKVGHNWTEPSYSDLKFTVWNCSYLFINLISYSFLEGIWGKLFQYILPLLPLTSTQKNHLYTNTNTVLRLEYDL